MTFLTNGKLKVEQKGEDVAVLVTTSAPTAPFRKISSGKPKLDDA